MRRDGATSGRWVPTAPTRRGLPPLPPSFSTRRPTGSRYPRKVGTEHMTKTKSYFLRPRVLLIGAALAASVMAVVLASPASTAQTTVQAGTPLAWGQNLSGQTDVPSGLTDVVAVAGGAHHSLALKSDGTVVAWGYNGSGQTDVPSGLTGVVDVAGGAHYSLALKSD